MWEYIYYLLGYEEDEVVANEKTILVRNEMLKQIKNSKLKLKPIKKEIPEWEYRLTKKEKRRRARKKIIGRRDV